MGRGITGGMTDLHRHPSRRNRVCSRKLLAEIGRRGAMVLRTVASGRQVMMMDIALALAVIESSG